MRQLIKVTDNNYARWKLMGPIVCTCKKLPLNAA